MLHFFKVATFGNNSFILFVDPITIWGGGKVSPPLVFFLNYLKTAYIRTFELKITHTVPLKVKKFQTRMGK